MLRRYIQNQSMKTTGTRFLFSTKEVADFTPLRQRNFISYANYTEIFNAVLGADSVNDMTNFLKTADGCLDDRMLSYSWKRIRDNNFQLDSAFNNNYLPLTTSYIRNFTDQNAEAFAEIVTCAGQLGVSNGEFWRAVKEVLVMKRMYRYMPLESFGDVIKSFAIVGQADVNTLQLLGDVVIKHKRHLT